jgi:MFS family permease
MKVVLGAEQDVVVVLVGLTVISATTVGALTGGLLTTKFLGSYTNRKSVYVCLVMLALLSGACFPLSYIEKNYYVFIGCVWLVMYFHGFIEPIFTGMLLNSVGADQQATASSMLIFMQMALGYLPAPYVYGLLVDETAVYDAEGDNVSRWGMRGMSFYSILGAFALMLSIFFRKSLPRVDDHSNMISIMTSNSSPEEKLLH